MQGLSRIGAAPGLFGVQRGGVQHPEREPVPEVRGAGLDGVDPCERCADTGFLFELRDGQRFAVDCACKAERAARRRLRECGIPPRYAGVTLSGYRPMNRSQEAALIMARGYAEQWPINRADGLALTGPCGVGKTHLAVAVMREVQRKGGLCHFVSMRQMLQDVKSSYGSKAGAAREEQILAPLLAADLAVMDEVGSSRTPSDWEFDTVARILNTRYDAGLALILTTNLAVRGARRAEPDAGYGAAVTRMREEETLGDRIGTPMISRVRGMCAVVEMAGDDFRERR